MCQRSATHSGRRSTRDPRTKSSAGSSTPGCLQCGEPVYFGTTPFVDDSFIAVDLEYQGDGTIPVAGTCVVRGDDRDYSILWADDARSERKALRNLAKVVEANPSLLVVTWSGDTADVPMLRKAAKRLRLGHVMEPMVARHVDLKRYAVHNIRLPIPTFGIKDLGDYWAIPRISTIRGGMDAQMLFAAYLRSGDGDYRAMLREQLIDYNRDDIDALVAVAGEIRELTTTGPSDGLPHALTA
jgi:predicted RecB family nuclease